LILWPLHILRIIICMPDEQFAPGAWSGLRGVVSTWRRRAVRTSRKILSTARCTEDMLIPDVSCGWSREQEVDFYV
jgi:hypothetical protein